MRAAFLVLPLVLAGCATVPVEGGGAGADKQRLINLVTFDVATCWPPLESVPAAVDAAVVTGALLATRPAMLECLVPPGSRGQAAETRVVVQTTVDAAGAKTVVKGDNLSASGQSCIEHAVQQVAWKPLAKGAKPVTGALTVQHGPANPQVRFGENEASDVAGKVRLALKDWCDCFTQVGDAAPPELEAKLVLKKGRVATASFVKGEGPLPMCLLPRLQALEVLASAQELMVPLPLLLLNSAAPEDTAGAEPELRFNQLDAVRGRRAAGVAMAVGARNAAVGAYDALVTQFKKKVPSVQLKQLKDGCAAMLRADDALIAADQKQLDTDQQTQALARSLAAKDAAWAEAAKAAQAQVDGSKSDVEKAQAARAADAAVCPKEHY